MNPCKDPSMAKFTSPKLQNQSYDLFDFAPDGLIWAHSAFSLDNSNLTEICGAISYNATYGGLQISSTSTPLRFDSDTREFGLYAEDSELIGS